MKKTIKQSVGIDVAQDELVVCFTLLQEDLSHERKWTKAFTNNAKGFKAMISLVKKHQVKDVPVCYVCEATGVYHEAVTYFLHDAGYTVHVVLPNKIVHFIRSLDVKTINDFTSADGIAQFGFRTLTAWHKPNCTYKTMRHLTRERGQLVEERTLVKNQLHAEKAQAEPHPATIERSNARVKMLNKQEKEILVELHQLIAGSALIKHQVDLITSIPGIGELTAASILAETDGFALIENKRQLTSYAGLDVIDKTSGTSIKGKPRISKRGNKNLRKCLHLPALAAIRHEFQYKNMFVRLVGRHGIKMKAAVAVQRKLLELSYTLVKKNEMYQAPEQSIEKLEWIHENEAIDLKKLVGELPK
jgi:transposase